MNNDSGSQVKMMGVYAIGVVSFAALTLIGVAVLTGIKDSAGSLFTEPSGCGGANATLDFCSFQSNADLFIAGLTIFGSFMVIVSLSLIGKVIIGLFKN